MAGGAAPGGKCDFQLGWVEAQFEVNGRQDVDEVVRGTGVDEDGEGLAFWYITLALLANQDKCKAISKR